MLVTIFLLGIIPTVFTNTPVDHVYPSFDITLPAATGADCKRDLQLLVNGLHNQSLWAMKMLDSSTQSSSGILYGSVWQLGNFDECVSVQIPVKAQYCLPEIAAEFENETDPNDVWMFMQGKNEPSSLPRDKIHVAICVPSSCTVQDIEAALQAQIDQLQYKQKVRYTVSVPDIMCTKSKQGMEFSVGEVAFWCCSTLLVLAALLGTLFHGRKTEKMLVRALKCFSVPSNLDRLLEFREEERNHFLTALHGIKVASIISILYGHRAGIPLGIAVSNYQEVEEARRTAHNMFIPQADLVVDTFFFISGVLTTYFMYHVMRKKPLNPLQAIFTRVARIAPMYMFVVWFQASAVHRLGSGPIWNMVQEGESTPCSNYWWTNALFINNYVSIDKVCLIHAWYLQCDVHFFIGAIFLIMLLLKHPRTGTALLVLLTVLTPLIPALIVYFEELAPIVLFYNDFLSNPRSSRAFAEIYIKSHSRVTVYLIGIAVGYFLYKNKDSKHMLSKNVCIWGVLLGSALLFTPMAIGGLYYSLNPPGPIFSAVYAAIRRPLWAMGLAVFLAIHRFGPSNMVSRAFGCRALVVLSKLTFGVYLIHFVLITANVAKLRTASPFNFYDVMGQGAGDLLSSCTYAVVLYLLIELPFKRLFQEVLFAKTIQQFTDDEIRKQKKQQENLTVKL